MGNTLEIGERRKFATYNISVGKISVSIIHIEAGPKASQVMSKVALGPLVTVFVCLSIYLSICLSVCLSVCLSICLRARWKTELLCEASSIFELDNIKKAAILRDLLIFELDNIKDAVILRGVLNF